MKIAFLFLYLFCYSSLFAQDTIKVNFLYGSKPAKGYKNSERKLFGGLKGGHVNIQLRDRVVDFGPGKCPIFPNHKKPTGHFSTRNHVYWDTATSKCTTITIPVTSAQAKQLDSLIDSYCQNSPYDYAVFGMRCAAASYDLLSKIGLFKQLPGKKNISKNFYPKLMRKRMIVWAKKKNYTITTHKGRKSRKWESDRGVF